MQEFTDALGRRHVIDVDLDVLDKVKAACGIDFVELQPAAEAQAARKADEMVAQLNRDMRTMCRVAHIAAGETLELGEFRKGFKGQAIDDALRAFLEGVIDFFPNRLAGLMRQAQARFDSQYDKITEALERAIAAGALDREIVEIPDELLPYFDRTGNTSTTSPAASDSTPVT